ncbi:SubName: Full=Uncharacterized protein {ECO:0000313/EMBL:CCA70409.1} [Serendipita indica DSM 11827]|uniref:Uncharacterized protein n=1 Tax=Serendipita indica (strain DSM 11827) TaxID=1109443 RepID=G4TGG6_SERID|nr:SubName: Full=Uncharacterized protein {ECO:0000313/EMBL:CCA70409.1} [Serendipita indica DSM 11827]CCA70409.1 hypothetical protein PIIN_04348 [Serendipita indica DSM 11827]
MDDHLSSGRCRRSTHRHPRSTRPVATVFAAVAALEALRSTTSASASPLPIPFLDFLYPSFERKSIEEKLSEPTLRSSTSTTAATSAAEARLGATSTVSKQHKLSKRAQPPGVHIAIKYEPAEIGWIEALSWNLHGRTGGSDPSPALDPSSGLDNIQNLDAIGTGTLTDMDLSQLPVGWYRAPRHESYSPIFVTVLAVVLVFSIMTTIGLCRWRKAHLRKLRDVEQLERQQKGLEVSTDEEGSDSEEQSKEKSGRKTPLRKRYKAFGKSTAIRRVNDRFVARLRRKHHRSQAAENTSNDAPAPDSSQTSVRSPSPRRADLSAQSRISLDDGPRPTSPATPTVSHALENTPLPHSPSNEPAEPPAVREDRAFTTSDNQPPAYPSSSTPTSARRQEKAPIRGREGDYDERDLTGYVRSFDGVTLAMPAEAPEVSTSTEAAPSFESSLIGSSRIAAGAIRQAHVATDDKVALERLRTMADAPVSSSPAPNRPMVPAWREMDEWHAEQQLESLPATEPTNASPPLSDLPLPPPPSTTVVPSNGYEIGHFWSYMGDPPSSSRAGPSAPPTDTNDERIPSLMPSAPPALAEEEGDGGVGPSAPVWDDSLGEVAMLREEQDGSTSSDRARSTSPSSSASSGSGDGQQSRSSGPNLPRYEP